MTGTARKLDENHTTADAFLLIFQQDYPVYGSIRGCLTWLGRMGMKT
jgi:hypothetical protein